MKNTITCRPTQFSLLALLAGLSAWQAAHAESFAQIPAGTYTIGDAVGDPDIVGHNHPHKAEPTSVKLDAYSIATTETTKGRWDDVREWAATHGYPDLAPGGGKTPEEPVRNVTWYQAVIWCNAASERDGLKPCYTLKGEIYRTGESDDVECDWTASGYRLPTEAEWEVAARGGLAGKRFPWGDTITHEQANYASSEKQAYDVSPTRGPHPNTKSRRWTGFSPVGSFPANGYGLHDVAGNAFEWCWDWYGPYAAGENPRGQKCDDPKVHPAIRASRVLRGGDCGKESTYARVAYRHSSGGSRNSPNIGFRVVRGSAPAR